MARGDQRRGDDGHAGPLRACCHHRTPPARSNGTMAERDCEVLVVGCGPTGVVLANLLGALGVRTVVLERDAQVFPVCRATHIDEETLRNFQATGLLSGLLLLQRPLSNPRS